MTFISSNIASSSGVGNIGGPLVPTWVSLTVEEHLQNFKRISNRYMNSNEHYYSDKFMKSIVKVIKALRMDPCGHIDHLLLRIPKPLSWGLRSSTPLHWAVWIDDRVMVRYILSSRKVNINATTISYWCAIASGQLLSALSYAIIGGNLEIVKDFVEFEADVFGGGVLGSMVHEKDSMFGILKRILADNVNACDEAKKTALHYAAREGYGDVVDYLLDEKAKVNLKDEDGYTPLHYAVESKSTDVVELLLQQNANANVHTKLSKCTPLHLAAKIGASDIVSLLVAQYAVVDARDYEGMTALLLSLKYENVDTFSALITARADVQITDRESNNALHYAIKAHGKVNDMTGIVRYLRDHDVDVNLKNSQGYSPFFVAVVQGHTELVKELLQSKEGIKLMEECNGETAIQIAYDNGHEHIKRMLLEDNDVSRYVETLYRDRQVYVDAANAILVGAALIASVTFASWLQPPLGYTTSYLDLAPSSSNIDYVDVQHNLSLRAFWIFNTLSFYFAIGTVVFGARSVLPRRQMFINDIVVKLRQNLLVTSFLLACSVLCVIVAFGIAVCIVLTPILKFQWYMIVPTILGGLVCLVSLGFLFKSMLEDILEKKRKTYQLWNY